MAYALTHLIGRHRASCRLPAGLVRGITMGSLEMRADWDRVGLVDSNVEEEWFHWLPLQLLVVWALGAQGGLPVFTGVR